MRHVKLFRQGRFDERTPVAVVESTTKRHELPQPVPKSGADSSREHANAYCSGLIAPGNAATLEALTDPAPAHPLRAPAPKVPLYRPSEEVLRSAHQVGEALRTSKRGSAPTSSWTETSIEKMLKRGSQCKEILRRAVLSEAISLHMLSTFG